MWLLTDEEIKDGIGNEYDRRYPLVRSSMSDLDCYNAVAKAQLKHVYEEGNKPCGNPAHLLPLLKRRNCIECWKELFKECE